MRRSLIVVVLSTLATVAAAQMHPNEDRGFTPDKVYSYSELDHVNNFNGNLVLTVPVGSTYRVRGQLTYGLALVYNSNVWDLIVHNGGTNPSYETVPNRRSNAGMGWQLTLGRLLPPSDPTNETNQSSLQWVFESPDGASHVMYSSDAGSTGYSHDGAYLRMRTAGMQRFVDWADGRVLTFTDHSANHDGSDWRLDQISDPFGNAVTIDYSAPAGYADLWTIGDSEGRTHKIYFIDATGTTHTQRLVDHVELMTAAGSTATYGFDYTTRTIARSPKDSTNAGFPGSAVSAVLLRHVWLPDATTGAAGTTSFGMQTPGATGTDPDPYYNVSGDYTGMIRGLQLPTRGWIEWDYTGITFPAGSADSRARTHTYGVMQRRLYDRSHALVGTWDYTRAIGNRSSCVIQDPNVCRVASCPSGGPRQLVAIVTAPPYDGTMRLSAVTYYSVFASGGDQCPNQEGWDDSEYSAPLTRAVVDSDRFLSSEMRDGVDLSQVSTVDGRLTLGTLLRSEYVTYESDSAVSPGPAWENNRRANSSRTNFDDDPNCQQAACYKSADSSSWDGHGHYRQTSLRSNFPQSAHRTTFTNFYGAAPANNAWIWNTFSEQCAHDDASATAVQVTDCSTLGGAITKANFDRTTGALLGRHILAGASSATNDLLSVFTYQYGNVLSEKYYGGDGSSQQLRTTDVDLFWTPTSPQYDVEHTYTFATAALAVHSASYTGMTFKAIDESFGSTGMVTSTRDSAGLQTNYEYDTRDRLRWVKPATGRAWLNYVYSDATSTAPAEVDVAAYSNGVSSGTPLTSAKYYYDPFGRLTKEQQLTSGGGWVTKTTQLNALGWRTARSELTSSDPPPTTSLTTFTYDAFGRALTVTPPGATTATQLQNQYTGERVNSRSSTVATSSSTETRASTTEEYDALGRLRSITTPSGATSASLPTGANVTTSYTYDTGDRLSRAVTTANGTTQERRFDYDNRGFLQTEVHPENGTTSYSQYDARGHVGTRTAGSADGPFDLHFQYDGAERITEVNEPVPTSTTTPKTRRPLKQYTFGSAADSALGKLLTAMRYNYLGGTYGTISVLESYSYSALDGTVSQRTTTGARSDVSQPIQTFTTQFSNNDLGARLTTTYPACTGCGAQGLTLTNGYSHGRLTSAGSYGTLAYSDNQTVNTVVHGNVTDTYTPDSTGMIRPSNVSFTGWTNCVISANVTVPTTVCSNSTGNSASVNATTGAAYLWSVTGGTITSGQGTSAVLFSAGASGQVALSVSVTTSCGSASGNATSNVDTPTAAVSGSTTIASGQSATIQAVLSGVGPWSVTWSDGVSQNNLTGTAPLTVTRSVSPTATTTYTVSSLHDATCSGTASGSATITVAANNAPTAVVARLISGQIVVSWTTAGADSYVVQRSFNGNAPADVATGVTGTSWTDSDGQFASRGVVTYVYYVRGVVGGARSPASVPDIATYVGFTDDPLTANVTKIRGYHVSELRQAVDAVRRSAGLPVIWGTYQPATGRVYAWIFYEAAATSPPRDLYNALNAARQQLGLAPVVFPINTEPVANRLIRVSNVDTLRAGVK
jgi:YD repeat-containing protein